MEVEVNSREKVEKVEAQGEDEEYLPLEAESARIPPGAVGGTVKRTVTGGSKSGGSDNNNG